MLSVVLIGDRELMARIDRMSPEVRVMLRRKVRALAIRLKTRIQKTKLSGQLLNVVTGALRRSITDKVREDIHSVTGEVFSAGDVKYAAIHEFGGKTKAHVIEPRKAEALAFMVGNKQVFARRVNHPGSVIREKAFMRGTLAEMSSTIVREMKEAVFAGLRKAAGR